MAQGMLTGDVLDAFLDEMQHVLENAPEQAAKQQLARSAVWAQLQQQEPLLKPKDIDTLQRVHRLALTLQQPDYSARVLDVHGPQILQRLADDSQRYEAEISLAFYRAEVADARHDAGVTPNPVPAALEAAAHVIASRPVTEQSFEAWRHLSGLAERAASHSVVRRCHEALHAIAASDPDRTRWRSLDRARLALNLGHSHWAEGDAAAARAQAQVAYDALGSAPSDQDIDHEDWLACVQDMTPLMPERVHVLAAQVRAAYPRDLAPGLRRQCEVQLARIEAKALHQTGDLAGALTKAPEGRFGLMTDEDDTFTPLVLTWLEEAGRGDELATVVFENAWNTRAGVVEVAALIARSQLSDEDHPFRHPHHLWPLVLAHLCMEGRTDLAPRQSGEGMAEALARWLAHSRALKPGNVEADLVEGYWLCQNRQNLLGLGKALPLLESAAREVPQLFNYSVAKHLLVARIQVHGMKAALTMPRVPVLAGGWAYSFGNLMYFDDEEIAEECKNKGEWPQDRGLALAIEYHRHAIERFESFFATGQGLYRDGSAHDYSMLCNNLGIELRSLSVEHVDEAIALHRKGLATSPFAEHHNSIVRCLKLAERHEELIVAAEELWRFSEEYGFSRHNPPQYFEWVLLALYHTDRDAEFSIWLPRLESWWRELDDSERADFNEGYHIALNAAFRNMAFVNKSDALARLHASLADMRATQSPDLLRLVGDNFEICDDLDTAMQVYREASQCIQREEEPDERVAELVEQALVECQARIDERDGKGSAKNKAWWKVW